MACCTMAVGKDPNPGWQWIEAAVEYEHARTCSFVDGGIAHVGSIGMCLRKGTADILIEGNDIGDLGGGGIAVGYTENAAYGYVHAPPPEPNEFKGYRIVNNHVHDCGMEDYGAFGILACEIQDSVIAHNLVHDTAYFGIAMAGSQRRDEVFAKNNTIERNHIYNAMKVTVDGAGMYLTFALPHPDHGCLILGNLLHDIYPNRFSDRAVGPYSAAGIYLDGHATGYRLENNVVFKTGSATFVNGRGTTTWGDNILLENESPPPEFLGVMEAYAGLEPVYRQALMKAEPKPCVRYVLVDSSGQATWSALQFDLSAGSRGVVQVIVRDGNKDDAVRFKLRGLSAKASYELKIYKTTSGPGQASTIGKSDPTDLATFGLTAQVSGKDILDSGMAMKLGKSSQVIWIVYQMAK